jgi:hypothetical protein
VSGDRLLGARRGPEIFHAGSLYSSGWMPASLAIFTQVAISCAW